jgi:adenylate kinase family enzyme
MNQHDDKLVINIIGYPGCGKSSVCKLLANNGFYIHRPSDIIRAYAAANRRPLNGRQDYIDVHRAMNLATPYAIVDPVIASGQKQICIDGLRCPVLLDKLQAELPRVVTIALDCPIEERFRRVQADDARQGTHRAPDSLAAFRADELPDYQNPDRNLPNMQEMMSRAVQTFDAAEVLPQDIATAIIRRYTTQHG